jgi:hypothetical protein
MSSSLLQASPHAAWPSHSHTVTHNHVPCHESMATTPLFSCSPGVFLQPLWGPLQALVFPSRRSPSQYATQHHTAQHSTSTPPPPRPHSKQTVAYQQATPAPQEHSSSPNSRRPNSRRPDSSPAWMKPSLDVPTRPQAMWALCVPLADSSCAAATLWSAAAARIVKQCSGHALECCRHVWSCNYCYTLEQLHAEAAELWSAWVP